MDWGKTKSILIITFLLLNALLGYQLYLKYLESDHVIWGKESTKEIQEILAEREIIINDEISVDQPMMEFIRTKIQNYEGELTYDSVKYAELDEMALIEILGSIIKNFNEYGYDEHESSANNQHIFYQMKDSYPLYGGQLLVETIGRNQLHFEQAYFEIVGEGAKRKIISSATALKSAIDLRLIPNNSEIDTLTLGYYGEGVQSILQEIPPVWRVVYKYDDIINVLHINAFTGENMLKLG